MFSHVFGHELRLEVKGELAASQVCRTDAEILDVQERWRVAMNAKGWRLDSGTKATDGHAHENTT